MSHDHSDQDRPPRFIDPDLDQHDREQSASHQRDRAPIRHATWPKKDERSSSRLSSPEHLTPEERETSWPLG